MPSNRAKGCKRNNKNLTIEIEESFPVESIHAKLKKKFKGQRVSKKAAVYFSTVLQYLVLEVIMSASKIQKNQKIQPEHVHYILNIDPDFSRLISKVTIPIEFYK
ncbi:hypothetical protein CDAR_103071 [Caerostris darwini]|uniref:Histone H2A n=1 Tax=Caerostris darwini TaxID=1538125 RepID=A0AAV4V386_9ARAC|nr:hypothetical protein CDAR_103071 [Caerostris darwini]